MPDRRGLPARADLPAEFTPDTVRELPIATLRKLADHHNGVLSRDEQRAFDRAVHEVMRDTAQRVSRQLTAADWSTVRRGDAGRGGRTRGPSSRADKQLSRLARRIGEQVDLAETLAPDVDWSFAQPDPAPDGVPPAPPTDDSTDTVPDPDPDPDDHAGTVSDLESRINEQVELVEVMSEIAEISRRTYTLEQQRDLQSTRSVFFGLVVSVAVLVAGWAPLVAADDWTERWWDIGLTLGTCVLAAAVYGLVRQWQDRKESAEESADGDG